MLLRENAFRQRMLVVAIEDRHRLLHDNGSMIELLIHKVNSAACDFYAVRQCLFLRLESGKRRQKRRVDI